MKKYIFILLSFLCFILYLNAQDKTNQRYTVDYPIYLNENGIVSFKDVVEVKNASADFLYKNARLWVKNKFNQIDNFYYSEDTINRVLKGEVSIMVDVKYSITTEKEKMNYKFIIQTWNEKYQAEIFDINYKSFEGRYFKAEEMITEDNLYRRTGRTKRLNISYKEVTINLVNDFFNELQTRIFLVAPN